MAITYPVEPNSRWAFWNTATQSMERHNVRWPRSDGMEIQGLDPDIVPLRETRDARPVPEFDPEQPDAPVYDPATEIVETGSSVVDVDANTHNHTWNIRLMTQQELDEKAAQEAAQAEEDLAKSFHDDLKNGVGTQIERLERAEKVSAHLLKVKYGL